MLKGQISTQPYKGARDFYPEDMYIREYIFSVWRKVCESYGYEEYDGPLIEDLSIYEAKTGEEIVNNQVYSFEDRGGRKVAIRPEMTPTVARMIAQKHKTLFFPIRWFSIPNLWRYENPQKGRLREHYQLNVDIFGVDSVTADYEILSIALDIMKEFGATEEMFEIKINNRRLIEDVYAKLGLANEQKTRVSKAIDKKSKITDTDFINLLEKDAKLDTEAIKELSGFLENPAPIVNKIYEKSKGAQEIRELLELLESQGKSKYVKFDPQIMRGFDYYTGNIFEQFDLDPDNSRSMYGGGRYDNLVETFIDTKIPGIGLGMGDVTMQIFLENWNLLPSKTQNTEFFVTVWPNENKKYLEKSLEIARILRNHNRNSAVWTDTDTQISKQLKFADRNNYKYVVIIGEEELDKNLVTLKNMEGQDQISLPFEEFINSIK